MRNIKAKGDFFLRYNSLFKKKLIKVLNDLEDNHDNLSKRQNDRFISLFRHAVKRSSFYQKLYADYGLDTERIESVDEIHLLPIVSKEMIKEHIDDIVIGHRFFKVKGYTSGTTGTPLKVYRDYSSILEEGAYIWAQRVRHGHWPGMKTISMRGDLERDELVRFDSASNTLYLSSYNLNERNATYFYEKIAQFSPNAILAYPSSVETLATLLDTINKTVHIPFTFTSSETLYEFQREKIHRILGSNIQDWYGNAERTIALMQHSGADYSELPLYSINEYRENCTITTGLINKSFPLIRYQINDILIPKSPKISPSQQTTITKILGRDDDVLNLPDGTRIGRLDVVFKNVENIQFAQFEQKNHESFDINVVVTDHFSQSNEQLLIEKIKARVGNDIQFRVNKVNKSQIKLSKSGKYKLVINSADS